jgi:hypothetical protein
MVTAPSARACAHLQLPSIVGAAVISDLQFISIHSFLLALILTPLR